MKLFPKIFQKTLTKKYMYDKNKQEQLVKKYKTAAILLIIHGGLFEISGLLAIIPIIIFKNNTQDISKYISFIVPYLQENIYLMCIMSGIYGTTRIISAIGLLKNRMWGFVLALINCIITMALMIFMLPAGIMDGILSCTTLVILLMEYFGKNKIILEKRT
jgi:uncharacterized membrane protein (DUF2068 family)